MKHLNRKAERGAAEKHAPRDGLHTAHRKEFEFRDAWRCLTRT